jgi:adenylate cyclase
METLTKAIGSFATIALGLIVVEQYHSVPTDTSVATAARNVSDKPSIAVLPLENVSADTAQQYIADGVTDALVAKLALADELTVVSRASSMQCKRQAKDLTDIGRESGAEWVVEGSIVKVRDRVRVTVQLIRAESDEQRWARSYERSTRDLPAMESDLARTISADLRDVLKRVVEN